MSTPLNIACHNRRVDVAVYLIDHGADVNMMNIFGDTSLMGAAKSGTYIYIFHEYAIN